MRRPQFVSNIKGREREVFFKRFFERNMAELFLRRNVSHAILQNRPIRYSVLKRNYTMLIDETRFLERLKPL